MAGPRCRRSSIRASWGQCSSRSAQRGFESPGPVPRTLWVLPSLMSLSIALIYLRLVPPGTRIEPGGFVPPGPPGQGPGPPGPPGIGVRPGTAPPGGPFIPPPPQMYPPYQQYPGVIPRTPTASESPVVPSPPSGYGDGPYIPPPLRESVVIPPGVYQPPVPVGVGDEPPYIPPEPSYFSRTPSIESPRSPRSPSLAPVFVPAPGQQPPPPIFVHPASQPPPSRRTQSPSESRTPTPQPGPSTIINMPQQPGLIPPAVPFGPSSPGYDDGPGQAVLFPPPQPPIQFQGPPPPLSRASGRSEFDGPRRETPQPPIIIHPPSMGPQTIVPPGPFGPPGMFVEQRPSRGSPRSSPSRSTRSPRSDVIGAPFPPPMFGPPLPGFGVQPQPGFGVQPGFGIQPVPPINIQTPSRASPEYRDRDEGSPRLYPSSSRPPSRFEYAEGPIPGQPFPAPMPVPTGVHIVSEPYRRSRYAGSRTPSSERSDSRERRRRRRRRRRSRTPSTESDEREPRRDRRRGSGYRSPSPSSFAVPIGAGPEYGGVGPPIIHPPTQTHIHAYPPAGPSPTRTSVSQPFTEERGGEPLPHPFGPPTQYHPSEQFPLPTRAPSGRRPSATPTIVEVTGHPEHIQVHPPSERARTESGRKYCIYARHI